MKRRLDPNGYGRRVECGRDNFERAITIAPETISLDDLPDSVDPEMVQDWIEAGGSGTFVMAPAQVKCPHCKAVFRTIHPGTLRNDA